MKKTQSSGTRPDHQKVAGTFEFKSNGKAITIGFTDQQLSPHAGSALFWAWLRPLDWCRSLAAALPHPRPTSNNQILPLEKALAFMHGLLCDARKLTQVADLRRDPLVPELLGIRRVASQSVLTRFFQGFTSAGGNLRCFRPLWHWGMNRLPSRKEGYTLDLDSTRLLHKDGQQEGVAGGYTKQGVKPCLHPLLAMFADVRLVAQLWLRPGNASCGNNGTAFFMDLWENLPRHIRLRGVRADSGFCLPELLALGEQLNLPYVVVARLNRPIQKIIRGDLRWTPTEVPGTEVAELEYQAMSWPQPRRLVLLRHRVDEATERGGKCLLDVPGYRFQALVTSLPAATHSPLAVWRYLQWPGRLRKRDQGTAGGLCAAHAVSGTVLGHGSGAESGQPDLQPDDVVPTAAGLAAESHAAQPAVLALRHGGRAEPSGRQDHRQTGRAQTGTGVVAAFMGKDFKPLPQLQCSRKPTHFLLSMLMNLRFQLHGFG